MSQWREGLRQLRRYPAAVAGLAIIVLLVAVSIYTVIVLFGLFVSLTMLGVRAHHRRNVRAGGLPVIPSEAGH